MKFIKKSSLYGDYKKAGKSGGGGDASAVKWKGDKVIRPICK